MNEDSALETPPANPLLNPSFRNLFTAQVIALVGTGMSTVALSLLAYDLAGGNAAVVLGTALAFKMVAYVVFAPIVGGLAHRFRRKPFLVAMDLVRAVTILAIPFVSAVWQVYLLIFLLNLFSAGFKPIFSATIPDILLDECQYTRALSMSRLAYDLENLLSPALAGIALLYFSYTGLFVANSLAFLISALLILWTLLPSQSDVVRQGGLWGEISFGVRSYLKTPRLRGLFALYFAVASASAMIIVNTVVYVRENLGGSETDVALALAVSGAGSMIVALVLPKALDHLPDRPLMLLGSGLMAVGIAFIYTSPTFSQVMVIWFVVGMGWSLVQTPSGRVVNRSSSPADRSAYFSAQFSLSHACWLVFYLIAGFAGTYLGIETTALLMALSIVVFTGLAAFLWPKQDEESLEHFHPEEFHEHKHIHDEHHDHEHEGWEGPEPHSHPHYHQAETHRHRYVIDDLHTFWPK